MLVTFTVHALGLFMTCGQYLINSLLKIFLKQLRASLKISNISAFMKFTKTIQHPLTGIIHFVEVQMTNSFLEGINRKTQLAKQRASGYRNIECLLKWNAYCAVIWNLITHCILHRIVFFSRKHRPTKCQPIFTASNSISHWFFFIAYFYQKNLFNINGIF